MKNNKNLISLKEASEISGYSSDYIGQLIRSGKISGEQVYSNIVWMTTKEEILAYKDRSKKTVNNNYGFFENKKRQILIQFKILKIIYDNSRIAVLLLFFFIFCFILVLVLFLGFFVNHNKNSIIIDKPTQNSKVIEY